MVKKILNKQKVIKNANKNITKNENFHTNFNVIKDDLARLFTHTQNFV